MHAAEALTRLGGVATRSTLLTLTTRRRVRTALADGAIVREARGSYALPGLDGHRRAAAELNGTLSVLSAARHYGWELKHVPADAWVMVPRRRKVRSKIDADVRVIRADLGEDDVTRGVTTPLRTVLDCARRLPFDEALTVADSALRAEAVTIEELRRAAAALHGPGASQARRVAAYADGRAANPFESVLRALAIECGLAVEPQVPVPTRTMTFHPDLVDRSRSLVIEADSWTWHRDQDVHARDCVRHTALAVAGWCVLRFNYAQVMSSPAYVRAVLTEVAHRGPATMAG